MYIIHRAEIQKLNLCTLINYITKYYDVSLMQFPDTLRDWNVHLKSIIRRPKTLNQAILHRVMEA